MAINRELLNDEQVQKVVGGLFEFYTLSNVVKFTHPDESVSVHEVLDYDKAWELCCKLESQNMNEEKIFQEMVDAGYIKG